jgi:NodT family efflux transporter outer membrane factor (OMF) lipoprotein
VLTILAVVLSVFVAMAIGRFTSLVGLPALTSSFIVVSLVFVSGALAVPMIESTPLEAPAFANPNEVAAPYTLATLLEGSGKGVGQIFLQDNYLTGALILVGIALFTGCAGFVRKEYQQPAVALPDQWQVQPETGEQVLAVYQWWQVFRDPELDRLITLVLKANNDLAAATIKVHKARLQAGLAATDFMPDLSVSANVRTQKDLDSGDTTDSSGTNTSLSWELDLWGRLAASRDAAQWEAQATAWDRSATALSLVGTTAGLYWQIAYLNQAITTSREGIAYTLKTLDLVRIKYQAGEVSRLDLLQAEQNAESQKADLADLLRQMAQAHNALAVLFDQPPERLVADPKQLSEMSMPVLDAGIPAAVLGNRPDLKAAELRLRGTLADADAARAGYYPKLSLTAALGTSSTELLKLLQNPVASLGAGLVLPFVQWNQARLNTRIADAAYEQAVIEFRQKLYEALQEVEDALSARQNYLVQEAALRRSCILAKEAEKISEVRYKSGKTGVQAWLDQQETRRTADLALARNRYNQLKNMMTLYQALGGDGEMVGMAQQKEEH